ncbi:MAG: hypothetical protein MI753_09575, partial [Hyphomicrobiales bacterium]|nr:hypothetical protein [Hyphomicrobiales bacterium]
MSSGEKWQFGLWFEQFGPFLTGAVTFILLLYFSDWIAERFASHGWNSSGLYSAIFGWSAI